MYFRILSQLIATCWRINMDYEETLKNSDVVNILLNIIIIIIVILLHFHRQTSDCRGQLLSRSKTSGGEIHTRKAKLSIHDAHHPSDATPMLEK